MNSIKYFMKLESGGAHHQSQDQVEGRGRQISGSLFTRALF